MGPYKVCRPEHPRVRWLGFEICLEKANQKLPQMWERIEGLAGLNPRKSEDVFVCLDG